MRRRRGQGSKPIPRRLGKCHRCGKSVYDKLTPVLPQHKMEFFIDMSDLVVTSEDDGENSLPTVCPSCLDELKSDYGAERYGASE